MRKRKHDRDGSCLWVCFHSLHALLEDRVPPGLTDDQISPLYDDDAGEEGRVARELHDLPLLVSLTDNT